MTLTDIRNGIVNLLREKDTITPDDFDAIEISEDLASQGESAVRAALNDLCEAGVVRALPSRENASMWVLTAPLGVAGQEVPLSLPTSIAIADEINAFIDAYEMEEWPRADALNLGEHNVLMLLGIIGELRSQDPADFDSNGKDDKQTGA